MLDIIILCFVIIISIGCADILERVKKIERKLGIDDREKVKRDEFDPNNPENITPPRPPKS